MSHEQCESPSLYEAIVKFLNPLVMPTNTGGQQGIRVPHQWLSTTWVSYPTKFLKINMSRKNLYILIYNVVERGSGVGALCAQGPTLRAKPKRWVHVHIKEPPKGIFSYKTTMVFLVVWFNIRSRHDSYQKIPIYVCMLTFNEKIA